MALEQHEQDRIWHYHQVDNRSSFDLSYPRLRFLAERSAPQSRILNIGVGSGYLEELLVRRGVEVYSLDPSAESIGRLQDTLGMGSRARQGYSQDIPFEAGYFDTVIMTEVLEHLSTAIIHPTLDEVRRVLKPGGELTGTVPYREDLKANEVMCPHCLKTFHRWGHERRFDAESLTALFGEHGFLMERAYPRAFPDFRRPGVGPLAKAVFRYLLGRMGEPLVAPNLYFRARTPAASR